MIHIVIHHSSNHAVYPLYLITLSTKLIASKSQRSTYAVTSAAFYSGPLIHHGDVYLIYGRGKLLSKHFILRSRFFEAAIPFDILSNAWHRVLGVADRESLWPP